MANVSPISAAGTLQNFRVHFLSNGKCSKQGEIFVREPDAGFFLGATAAPVFVQKRTDRLTDHVSCHNGRVALPAGCGVRVDVALIVFISGSDR